jgi:hypothetical protein
MTALFLLRQFFDDFALTAIGWFRRRKLGGRG